MYRHTPRRRLSAKMTSSVLMWTTMACLCWTSVSAQAVLTNSLYPAVGSNVTLSCMCHLDACDSVLWFRISEDGASQFLVSVNTADRPFRSSDPDARRFTARMKSTKVWLLHIANVAQKDTSVYSCLLRNKKTEAVAEPGDLLLPGETPPTTPAPTKPPPPACGCQEKSGKTQSKGCSSVVLWPVVGVLAGLSVALLSTLYYFSRLPKKCRHHFVKKGQMNRRT